MKDEALNADMPEGPNGPTLVHAVHWNRSNIRIHKASNLFQSEETLAQQISETETILTTIVEL